MPDEITSSAGAVVLREADGELKIVLARARTNSERYPPNTWVLPKGHIEAGESMEQAALREVREEVGLSNVQLIMYLGSFKRASKESWGEEVVKEIHIYLAYAFGNEQFQDLTDPFVTKADWFSLRQAIKYLPYDEDREFLKEKLAYLFKI